MTNDKTETQELTEERVREIVREEVGQALRSQARANLEGMMGAEATAHLLEQFQPGQEVQSPSEHP